MLRFLHATLWALVLLTVAAEAQTLKGVFGAKVSPQHRSAEYRFGYTGDRGSGDYAWEHRIHLQQSLGEAWMLRGIVNQGKREGGNLDTRWFRIETYYQFREAADPADVAGALRLDLQAADGDNEPGFVRLGTAFQGTMYETLDWRANLLLGRQVGPGAENDFFSEVRFQASRKLPSGHRIGAEYFAGLGFLDNMDNFDGQNHLIGPFVSGPLGDRFSYRAQVLFGLTESTLDNQFRLFVGYRF